MTNLVSIKSQSNVSTDNSSTMSQSISYARIASQTVFPKKEQAIVIESIEGIPVHEYTVAVGRIIDPSNIRFVSRISQGRVCLYLSSVALVDRLVCPGNNKINIKSNILEIRPLIVNTQRITFSNVCPIIPHEIIIAKLMEIGITPKSQMTFIRAGINEPGYSHIMSFRRQIYINPTDVEKLPGVLQINFDSTLYNIYVSTEKISCFLCKQEGHIAKHCKEDKNNTGLTNEHSDTRTSEQISLHSQQSDQISINSQQNASEKIVESNPLFNKTLFNANEKNNKRPISTTDAGSSLQQDYENLNDVKSPKEKKKKVKLPIKFHHMIY